jgi:cytochrome c oxidase cbb3-type subunit III
MNVCILLDGGPAATRFFGAISSGEEVLLITLALLLLAGMILVGVVGLYLMFILKRLVGPVPVAEPVEPATWWQRVIGLKPLSREKDLVMEHAYDGIAELDNPTPPWFMGLFYGSIAFGVIYLLVFHVIGSGDIMTSEYTQEMAVAEQQREEYIRKVAGSINENTVTQLTDAKGLDEGKVIFTQYCTACHGSHGEGKVGPNLTDAYWLHGGNVKAVFHTITEGVPEKGMVSWKKQLNPLQVQQVTSYVLSLQGTNPAGAKEPQGEKEASTSAVAMR